MRALLLVCLAACGGDDAAPKTTPLASDGAHLRDAQGRVAILRGVNARVRGVFDVTFSDGRVALETVPPLTPADCARMRQLGFDLLRLPINWSGIEPTRGTLDEGYLANVDAAIACADAAGMFVVVDIHQDAYSKEIGEDGAPLWAIQPPPAQLLQGPLTDLGDRRLSAQTRMAFATFFDPEDAAGLQAYFLEMIGRVAERYADNPAVIGFELFNEPDTGSAELDAFQAKIAAGVREKAPAKLVMFEPPALRNFTDFIPAPKARFPVEGAVYAPHVYTFVFQTDRHAFESATMAELEPSVSAARDEATAYGTPLWIGEYGVGPGADPQLDLWMQSQAILHDRYFASDAFWLWKEQSQGAWGIFDHDDASDTWTERPQVVSWISRVHAARVAGTPTAIDSNAAGDSVRVAIAPGSATSAPTLLYIPERFAATTRVTCDGAPLDVARDPATGLVEAPCAGELVAAP